MYHTRTGGQDGRVTERAADVCAGRNCAHCIDSGRPEGCVYRAAAICVYTGARHTFASEYIRVDGDPPYVLASDNVHLFENLREHRASATFDRSDESANIAAQQRMIMLACGANASDGNANSKSNDLPCDRIIPGHDPAQFQHYPTNGRIAHIR